MQDIKTAPPSTDGASRLPGAGASRQSRFDWLTIGVAYRGRFESPSATGIMSGNGDGYHLSRLRVNISVVPVRYLKFFVEAHDGRSWGYDSPSKPKNFNDTFDLRQAYVVLSKPGEAFGVSLRVGRQELNYGSRRLVAAPEWSNTSRTFDAAVLSLSRPGAKLDLFASSVVQIEPGHPDHHEAGDNFYGAYVVLDRLVPQGKVEPFFFWKVLSRATGERGDIGDSDLYTGGFRVTGKAPGRIDYSFEIARQRGSVASDRLSALAGSHTVGWTIGTASWKPRISGEFSHASGDGANRDGRRGTFDSLYPSNHANYGIADMVGWRNIRVLRSGFDCRPFKSVQANIDFIEFYLASPQDALYADGGSKLVLNRLATSRHVGSEIDFFFTYEYSKRISLGAGYSHVFPGAYLKQSTRGLGFSYPYFIYNVRF